MFFDTVEAALKNRKKQRPLTALEISLITDKSRAAIFKEIKTLLIHKLIERIELKITGTGHPIVLYKLK